MSKDHLIKNHYKKFKTLELSQPFLLLAISGFWRE